MPSALRERLLQQREQIIDRFVVELRQRELGPEGLSRSLLRDHLPQFFEEVVRELGGERESLPEAHLPAGEVHGAERWRQGFDIRALVREYGVLRHVILKDLAEANIAPSLAEVDALLNCLNAGMAAAVEAFATESELLRTSLDAAKTKLDSHERRLRMLTEFIPQIVWIASSQGALTWLNRQWFDYTGADAEASLGTGWTQSVHAEDRDAMLEAWQRCVGESTPYQAEYRLRRRDGAYRWFLCRALPVGLLDDQGEQWFGTNTDIEEQKQTEASLRAATQESERLNRLKDEFLATVSHELRTPLQSVLGWARLLKTGHVDAERQRKALDTIERNAKAQSQLIEDILDVSRIITGKARIRAEPVQLAQVLQAACDTIHPAARAKGVALHVDVSPELGTLVGDADRLQQVAWNLLSNAVKFTPSGGHVEVTASRTASSVSVIVEDDGQGIPDGFLPHVFERFRQADPGPARAHGGLGVGLAIVRHIVELHGGTVRVSTRGIGKGSRFVVELPLQHASTPRPPLVAEIRTPSTPSLPSLAALEGLQVLVVDDQPDARELIVSVLEQYGATVREAATARDALDLVQSTPFDVLVSDIGLPLEDGYSLIQRLRAREGERRLPALALTAYAREEDRRRALAAGFDQHAAKPIEPARLIAAVQQLGRGGATS